MNMDEYWKKNYRVGKFGIKYLDEHLNGISKNDLIIIGSRSGAGKTSIATRIFNVNNQNVKCKLFLLENFDGDLYSNNVFIKYRKYSNQDITQRQWLMNDFKVDYEALSKAEKEVKDSMNEKYIITRQPDYTIKKLKDDMIKAVEEDGCELLIIDHLDYVDKDNPTENDISHITDLMKTIRRLQDTYNVAVVAISHLRKPDHAKIPVKIPNENEFIGSSNKVKEATVVIMFAPDDEGNLKLNDPYHRRTWCCIRKNRFGGIDGRCANLVYDTKMQCYSDVYEIHSVNYLGTETCLLGGEK